MTDRQALGIVLIVLSTLTVIETILARLWEQHRSGYGLVKQDETVGAQSRLLVRNLLAIALANFSLSVPVILLIHHLGRENIVSHLKAFVFDYKLGLPTLMALGIGVALGSGLYKAFLHRRLRAEQDWRSRSLGLQGGVAWTWLVCLSLMLDWRGAENLNQAVRKNNLAAVQNFVDNGEANSTQLDQGLQESLELSDTKMLELLLRLGARPSQELLLDAIKRGKLRAASVLLAKIGPIDSVPLLVAVASSGQSALLRQAFVQGCTLSLTGDLAERLWRLAFETPNASELVSILLEHHLDPNLPLQMSGQRHDATVLMLAIDSGHGECLGALLKAGAVVKVADQQGWTALHVAAYKADSASLQLLLAAGADRLARTKNGELASQLTSDPTVRKMLP